MGYLTQKGYVLPKKKLDDSEIKNIRRKLTLTPKVFDECNVEAEPFKIYQEDKKNIYVPRFYGTDKHGDPKKNLLHEGIDVDIEFKEELRDYQIPIVKKLYKHLTSKGGGVLVLPCGRGKTAIAIKLITMLKKKALIIVHKSFLMRQWKERFEQFTNARIGIIQRDVIDVEDKDVVIAMLKSLSTKDYDPAILETFQTVIIDEVHHVGAKQSSRALPKVVARYSLGLSATPERADDMTKLIYWHIGGIIYREDAAPNESVIVNIYKYKSTNPKFKQYWNWGAQTPNREKTISELVKLPERNNFTLKILNELRYQNEKRKILILSGRLDHLELLKKRVKKTIKLDKKRYDTISELKKNILSSIKIKKRNKLDISKDQDLLENVEEELNMFEQSNCHNHTVGNYIGAMKEKELKESESCDIIFGTYAMASEGLDIEALNSIILATPRRTVTQSVGRILRKLVNELNPVVVDITDQLPFTSKQLKARQKYYNNCQYNMCIYGVRDNKIGNEFQTVIEEIDYIPSTSKVIQMSTSEMAEKMSNFEFKD